MGHDEEEKDKEERAEDHEKEEEEERAEHEEEDDDEELKKQLVAETARAIEADRERGKLIRTLCETAGISRGQADNWCDKGVSVEFVRNEVQKTMESNNAPVGESVQVTRSAIDNARDAVRDGLLVRSYASARINQKAEVQDEGLKQASLLRMAEVILRAGGIDTDRLAP